jgi:hypothetical protein
MSWSLPDHSGRHDDRAPPARQQGSRATASDMTATVAKVVAAADDCLRPGLSARTERRLIPVESAPEVRG